VDIILQRPQLACAAAWVWFCLTTECVSGDAEEVVGRKIPFKRNFDDFAWN